MPPPATDAFRNLPLPGGFLLASVELDANPLTDAIGRAALAKTTVEGSALTITLALGQSDEEQSISLYHELLEGLTVAWSIPPAAVIEFCEADFEREAREAHNRFGVASPASVLAFLAAFDFR